MVRTNGAHHGAIVQLVAPLGDGMYHVVVVITVLGQWSILV